MKKIPLLLLLISTSIYTQVYRVSDFNLNGNVKKVSVVCYDISNVDGEYLEGFPYSSQSKYHTDLNLHYLEFNSEGLLSRSRLYYPRDFYGQFQWMVPQFNLEESDFGPKKNYLGMDYRYRYTKIDDITEIRVFNSTNSLYIKVDSFNRLLEDEYYSYTYIAKDDTNSVLKRRKGSQYDFRRLDSVTKGDRQVTREYINNKFPQSQRVIISSNQLNSEMFISLGRINGFNETLKDGLVIERESVDLSWRNRINPWPEVEFSEDLTFDDFLKGIPRPFTSYKSLYSYNEELLIEEEIYEVKGNREKIESKYDYIYDDNNLLLEVLYTSDPLGESLVRFKTYIYDKNRNWVEKLVGRIEVNSDGEGIRVPEKRYVRTLTYY